jgi:ubiquinol oxidase
METRAQQDNEQWHLLILTELIDSRGDQLQFIRHRVLPQLIAVVYYYLAWAMYVVRPAWSYRLNADFEDHAEHEYMQYVAENPELDDAPYVSEFAADYGSFDTLADLFRQIGYDERVHKTESLSRMAQARFD